MDLNNTYYINLLLNNELLKIVIKARLDSLVKMINLYKRGYLPLPNDEGATGALDNKGGLFLPGGLVMEDVDKNLVLSPPNDKPLTKNQFTKQIVSAMQHDNATLMYKNKIYFGVNLHNGFFTEVASKILTIKRFVVSSNAMPKKVNSEEITRYFSPLFIKPPYGARTKLSSCLGVCLSEVRLYFIESTDKLKIRKNEFTLIWRDLSKSLKPAKVKKSDTPLFMPHIVVCHTSRYLSSNFVGITRIIGFGGFGDYALLTFEKQSNKLKNDLKKSNIELKSCRPMVYKNIKTYCILRVYFYGGKSYKTFYVDLKKDLDINYASLIDKSKTKYEQKQ